MVHGGGLIFSKAHSRVAFRMLMCVLHCSSSTITLDLARPLYFSRSHLFTNNPSSHCEEIIVYNEEWF